MEMLGAYAKAASASLGFLRSTDSSGKHMPAYEVTGEREERPVSTPQAQPWQRGVYSLCALATVLTRAACGEAWFRVPPAGSSSASPTSSASGTPGAAATAAPSPRDRAGSVAATGNAGDSGARRNGASLVCGSATSEAQRWAGGGDLPLREALPRLSQQLCGDAMERPWPPTWSGARELGDARGALSGACALSLRLPVPFSMPPPATQPYADRPGYGAQGPAPTPQPAPAAAAAAGAAGPTAAPSAVTTQSSATSGSVGSVPGQASSASSTGGGSTSTTAVLVLYWPSERPPPPPAAVNTLLSSLAGVAKSACLLTYQDGADAGAAAHNAPTSNVGSVSGNSDARSRTDSDATAHAAYQLAAAADVLRHVADSAMPSPLSPAGVARPGSTSAPAPFAQGAGITLQHVLPGAAGGALVPPAGHYIGPPGLPPSLPFPFTGGMPPAGSAAPGASPVGRAASMAAMPRPQSGLDLLGIIANDSSHSKAEAGGAGSRATRRRGRPEETSSAGGSVNAGEGGVSPAEGPGAKRRRGAGGGDSDSASAATADAQPPAAALVAAASGMPAPLHPAFAAHLPPHFQQQLAAQFGAPPPQAQQLQLQPGVGGGVAPQPGVQYVTVPGGGTMAVYPAMYLAAASASAKQQQQMSVQQLQGVPAGRGVPYPLEPPPSAGGAGMDDADEYDDDEEDRYDGSDVGPSPRNGRGRGRGRGGANGRASIPYSLPESEHGLMTAAGLPAVSAQALARVKGRARAAKPKLSVALRRGKWPTEEENFTNTVVDTFRAGILPLAEGTTLRTYLSGQLHWCVIRGGRERAKERMMSCAAIMCPMAFDGSCGQIAILPPPNHPTTTTTTSPLPTSPVAAPPCASPRSSPRTPPSASRCTSGGTTWRPPCGRTSPRRPCGASSPLGRRSSPRC